MGPGTVLHNDFGVTEFLRTGAETDGELHVQRVTHRPGSPFPRAHLHPGQEERCTVEDGTMVFSVDGSERVVGVGGTITIPAGAVHTARNASEEAPATVLWETRPALRTAEFLVAANRMGPGLLPRVLLVAEYRDVFRLPPPTNVLVPPLARLASLLGKRLPED